MTKSHNLHWVIPFSIPWCIGLQSQCCKKGRFIPPIPAVHFLKGPVLCHLAKLLQLDFNGGQSSQKLQQLNRDTLLPKNGAMTSRLKSFHLQTSSLQSSNQQTSSLQSSNLQTSSRQSSNQQTSSLQSSNQQTSSLQSSHHRRKLSRIEFATLHFLCNLWIGLIS